MTLFRSNWSYRGFTANQKTFRELQHWVALFNTLNSQGIFFIKLFFISSGTLRGYTALSSWDKLPRAIVSSVLFSENLVLYSVVYEKAFAVPDGFKAGKKAVLVGIMTSKLGMMCRAYAKRCVRSIPNAGIRVGSFHTFERLSTPIFIDFIVRNVVGLLVMQSRG